MARALVALSLVLNLVFALLLVREQWPDTPGEVAKQPSIKAANAQSTAASNPTETNLQSYYRALDTKGLNEKERAALMLAYLQEGYGQSDARQQPSTSFCDAPEKVLDRARDEALSSLGSTAVEDPVFGCLFRPLAREYPGLGAQEQMAVHRLLESYYSEVSQAESHAAKKDSYKRLLAGASDVLSPSEYDEFILRASPLAQAIRRMNLQLDDTRFGSLVRLVAKDEHLSQLVLGHLDESQAATFRNAQIAELLGREGYVRFAYSVDPIGAGAPVGELGKSLAHGVPAKTQAHGFHSSPSTH